MMRKNQKKNRLAVPEHEITIMNSRSPFLVKEAYKTLRTNVVFSLTGQGCHVIAVTSSNPGEGKSSISINLAIAFADSKQKVLAIEADMRLPSLTSAMGVTAGPGLSDLLVNQASVSSALVKTQNPYLDFLPAGVIPPNPSELLSSDNFSALIQALKEHYDYILIDTPPVNVVSDAVVISRETDGVVMVCRCDVAEKKAVDAALKQLQFANAHILGLVLNDVPVETGGSYRRHYYRSYSDYGGSAASSRATAASHSKT